MTLLAGKHQTSWVRVKGTFFNRCTTYKTSPPPPPPLLPITWPVPFPFSISIHPPGHDKAPLIPKSITHIGFQSCQRQWRTPWLDQTTVWWSCLSPGSHQQTAPGSATKNFLTSPGIFVAEDCRPNHLQTSCFPQKKASLKINVP